MRTAEEMAGFIIEKVVDISTVYKEEEKRADFRMKFRLNLTNTFRSIERVLEDGDDVLYAMPAASLGSTQRPLGKRNDAITSVAAVFTANRCILVHISTWVGKETFRTIPYDEIIEIRAKPAPKKLFDSSWGELIVSTTTDILRFRTCYYFTNYKRDRRYAQFVPEQACEAVTALVTKYKQAKCAAQQGAAAPQQPQQTPPPPQETSQQTAAPAAPQQAAPAAPSAGAGLPAETVEALKQLKDLLDAGILTQEEFDAKKKQLLGL